MAPKQAPPTLQQLLRMAPDENVCQVPYACTDMGGVQPQPRPSANSASHLFPPSDGDSDSGLGFVAEYHEATAAMTILWLKEYMEHFLPDVPENYRFRGRAYSAMADINLEIKRGVMDDEIWTYHYMGALSLLENMFESEGFDRDGCLAKLPRLPGVCVCRSVDFETDEFVPLAHARPCLVCPYVA